MFILLFLMLFSCSSVFACDICALYSPIQMQSQKADSFNIGIAEQFTSFEKVQLDNHYVENELNQHLESSITQIFAGYDITDTVGFQLNLPYINRRFKRAVNGEAFTGTEAGIGDLTLLGVASLYNYRKTESTLIISLFGGLKFPTGDSKRIREEISDSHHESDEHSEELLTFRHGDGEGDVESAIHGHDLALGSGSYDLPIGVKLLARNKRWFLSGNAQYTFRTEGDYSYRYADDLHFSVMPAYCLSLTHDSALSIGVALSGEHKANDRIGAKRLEDTAVNSLFLGPTLVAHIKDALALDLALDMPVDTDNSSLQIAPSYRLRGGVTIRF